jgi:hydrogenase expression/formation protein HypE
MRINMTHGSGGIGTRDLIRDVFAQKLGNSILNRMEDAAVLQMDPAFQGRLAYTTDSFVVSPLFFKGGDIGRLAVCGTVNDLLSMGAIPRYLSAGFIIEEGLPIADLEIIVTSMAEALMESGVMLVAADTKVIEGRGGLYINTSGIGVIHESVQPSAYNLEAGDAVLLTGTLGDHHACILSHRMEIENNIASDAAPLNDLCLALFDHGIRVKAIRDVTRGGLATVLNELSEASGCAIHINQESIPVREDVASLCGILGMDPLYMGNEGKMVICVGQNDVKKALELIGHAAYGERSQIIGQCREGQGVFLKTASGVSRVLHALYGEGLPRIC